MVVLMLMVELLVELWVLFGTEVVSSYMKKLRAWGLALTWYLERRGHASN